ncbi:MAG: phosphatidylinositol dimannoside acyltransferase [Frankiales bacterium]|jgi:lauroyl/myristoyl acyltransferase|nr:phosphatidylinositol dimannoside acyltransferase [Frankiales bacterium]
MKERLSAAAYAVAWSTVRTLPESIPRNVFRLLADGSSLRHGRTVRRLEANLRRVVPGASPDELRELTRQGMRSYLRYWLEVFRLPSMPASYIVENHVMHNDDRLKSAFASGRGVILALPHMGNWDAAGAWSVGLGMPFTTVAERLRPESLFDRFVEFRQSLGMEVLPLTGGSSGPFTVLRDRLEAGGLLALLADRDLTASGTTVNFFGEPARMPGGPAALALATGAALIPVTLWFPEDGSPGWRGHFHEEIEQPTSGSRPEQVQVMTQALADTFASSIAQHPTDWHMVQKLWVADLDPQRDALRTGAAA